PLHKAAPFPVLWPTDQTCSKRVSLDIPAETQEVVVVVDGKRLESALIDGAGAGGVVPDMPTLGVTTGKPVHECRQVAVGNGTENKVEVVGHQTIGETPNR